MITESWLPNGRKKWLTVRMNKSAVQETHLFHTPVHWIPGSYERSSEEDETTYRYARQTFGWQAEAGAEL